MLNENNEIVKVFRTTRDRFREFDYIPMCLKSISTRDQMKKTYAPKAGSEVVALIVGEIGIMSRPDPKDRHVATATCP